MGLHQIKCFCPVKEIITRVKRQTAEWEKILDNKYMKNFWHPYHNGNADQCSMRFHITQSEWLSPNYNTIIHNSQAMGTAKMLHN
jgi:hypothetical protein